MAEYKCVRIREVNLDTGHCIVFLEGYDRPVTGAINDPAVKKPQNIYTKAMHLQSPLSITAKPVLRDGEIKKLHISDAR